MPLSRRMRGVLNAGVRAERVHCSRADPAVRDVKQGKNHQTLAKPTCGRHFVGVGWGKVKGQQE